MILDFDNDMPTSSRVFLNWIDVVKIFFFPPRNEFCDYHFIHLPGLPGLLLLLSSPVHYFFLRMYQIVDLVTLQVSAFYLTGLFYFVSLITASFICIGTRHILRVLRTGYQLLSQHLESTPDLISFVMK